MNLQIDNQLEVCSMMRSGHHAVLYWLFGQIDHMIYFKDDILRYANKELEGALIGGGDISSVIKTYVYNIEDAPIDKIEYLREKYKTRFEICAPKKRRSVMIIRDPFNMFASRYRLFLRINRIRLEDGKAPFAESRNTNENSNITWIDKNAVNLWKIYAKEFLGYSNHLGSDVLKINYNKWFSNILYRKEISENMNLKFSDKKLNYVPENGHGSSFDVRSLDGSAQKMDVLNRWRRFSGNKKFKSIFSDKEMINLSLEIYPDLTKDIIEELGL